MRPAELTSAFRRFIRTETSGSVVLMGATLAALVVANTPLGDGFHHLLHRPVAGATLEHAINDGLMALFFLVVGVEIKHELLHGELAGVRKAALPAVAALGGMVVPAAIYTLATAGTGFAGGWGIPMATDIAFAVGVLALLGTTQTGLTVFLTALAIVDDLGAVLVIALFYVHNLSLPWLGLAALGLASLIALNRLGVQRLWPYLLLGLLFWAAVLGSGVHATIAGVALGFVIPAAPAERLENALETWVAFAILPLFALANAGVRIPWHSLGPALTHPITVGVFLGLVAGKTLGIFGATSIAARLGWADRPADATTRQLLGVSALGGIGFTMAIFIATLAFSEERLLEYAKIGIIAASLVSALAGSALLINRRSPRSA